MYLCTDAAFAYAFIILNIAMRSRLRWRFVVPRSIDGPGFATPADPTEFNEEFRRAI